MKDKKTHHDKNEFGLVVSLTAAAVAAAGFYFLYGKKESEKNRRLVKSWVFKAKGEILEKLEMLGKISSQEFEDLIDDAVKAYEGLKGVTKTDLNSFKSEMLEHWSLLEKTEKNKKQLKSKKNKPTTATKKRKTPVKRKTKVTKPKTNNKKVKRKKDDSKSFK